MKRRSRSTPPSYRKRTVTEPGTPGPFTSDAARDKLQLEFPGASPRSTRKVSALKKQLFQPMQTRGMSKNMSSDSSQDTAAAGTSAPSGPLFMDSTNPSQQTPPEQMMGGLGVLNEAPRVPIDEAPRLPRARERDPPDLQDVITQQTEILAGMMAELRARQAQPAAQAGNAAEPPEDPAFDWSRLVLPPETNFQVPGRGMVQRMATSLFARVPTLAGRDQHVLQVISLWPDLRDEERAWAFQRLNVYCIVAALGWPAATAACASSAATADFVLPQGVVLPPPGQQQQRRRRDQQPAVAAQQPAQQPAQQQRQQPRQRDNRRNNNQRGRGGGAAR